MPRMQNKPTELRVIGIPPRHPWQSFWVGLSNMLTGSLIIEDLKKPVFHQVITSIKLQIRLMNLSNQAEGLLLLSNTAGSG